MLRLFVDNLLPVILAAAVGYALAARVKVQGRALARVAFLVFSPCMVYQVLLESRLSAGDMARMGAFSFTVLLLLGGMAFLIARSMRWSRSMTAATVLVVLLPNAANIGLSVNYFAFGDAGLAQASLFFVSSAVLTYTVGVFIASLGRSGVRAALLGLPKVPTVWAVIAALVMSHHGWDLPFPVARTVELLSDACIPVFLVILGIELHGVKWGGRARPLMTAVGLRLVGGAVLGIVAARVFGLEGPARQAGVLEAAMPSAVVTIILASEYEVEPSFVTSVVFVTTLLCPFTLTPLMAFLGA